MKTFKIIPKNVYFCLAVRKDVKDETDDRMTQFKKKAKELRILDAKTAQNLCKYTQLFFFFFLIISFQNNHMSYTITS